MIPEIDIWWAAQLMLKRYGDNALEESAARANELALAGDDDGAATWRHIMTAVEQLANKTPPGRVNQYNGQNLTLVSVPDHSNSRLARAVSDGRMAHPCLAACPMTLVLPDSGRSRGRDPSARIDPFRALEPDFCIGDNLLRIHGRRPAEAHQMRDRAAYRSTARLG